MSFYFQGKEIAAIYKKLLPMKGGLNAQYIPQLARVNPDYLGKDRSLNRVQLFEPQLSFPNLFYISSILLYLLRFKSMFIGYNHSSDNSLYFLGINI